MAEVKSEIERLLDELEPQMRDAFLDAIQNISDETVLNALEDRIRAQDFDGAIQVVLSDPVVFASVADVFATAFRDAGTLTAENLRAVKTPLGARLVVRFDTRNLDAENWLREQSSRLIQGLTRQVADTVRAALVDGLARGQNPRTTALDIVGRISAQTGRRMGGLLGLTIQQAEYVASAAAELASGDPALLKNYLARQRRDARFDGVVRRALAASKAVSAADIQKMTGRYSDRLLQLRGEAIARSETLLSLHAGQDAAMRQAIGSGKVRQEDVVKIWKNAADRRVRDSHIVLGQRGGQKVALDAPFVSPLGSRLMYPGDRSLGALAADVINCRCHAEYKVDYVGAAARRFRATQVA
jgi:hypothetical protein